MPLVSVSKIWSARTPISSPATALPATRCDSISLRVRLFLTLSVTDFDECAAAGTDVLRAWADQTVVVVLLDDVRAPAGDAARGDHRGEEVDRDAERVEERRGIEIDVRDEALGFADPLVQLHGHLVPLELARLAAGLLRHAPEDRRAGIAGLVHA